MAWNGRKPLPFFVGLAELPDIMSTSTFHPFPRFVGATYGTKLKKGPYPGSVSRIRGGMGERFPHVRGVLSESGVFPDERRRGACPLSGIAARQFIWGGLEMWVVGVFNPKSAI